MKENLFLEKQMFSLIKQSIFSSSFFTSWELVEYGIVIFL